MTLTKVLTIDQKTTWSSGRDTCPSSVGRLRFEFACSQFILTKQLQQKYLRKVFITYRKNVLVLSRFVIFDVYYTACACPKPTILDKLRLLFWAGQLVQASVLLFVVFLCNRLLFVCLFLFVQRKKLVKYCFYRYVRQFLIRMQLGEFIWEKQVLEEIELKGPASCSFHLLDWIFQQPDVYKFFYVFGFTESFQQVKKISSYFRQRL